MGETQSLQPLMKGDWRTTVKSLPGSCSRTSASRACQRAADGPPARVTAAHRIARGMRSD
jgi:hypothetical protein